MEPNRNRTVLTSHPTWIGEFVKRAHKSVSSRIEFDSVRGTAGARRRAAHLWSAQWSCHRSVMWSRKGQNLQRAGWR